MRIESITLQNYRLFRELSCTFHPRLTVIVANNGGGKTTILDAIRIAFGTFLGAFPTGRGIGINTADVYAVVTNEELGQKQVHYPARIDVTAELNQNGHVHWFRSLNSAKAGTTIKEAKPLTQYANDLQIRSPSVKNWPLLTYYGTGRLWNQKRLTASKQFASGYYGREMAYADCMDPASSHKFVLGWLRYAAQANFDAKMKFLEATPSATAQHLHAFQGAFSPLLQAVQQAVNTVLAPSGWHNLSFSQIYKDAVVEHNEFGVMPVSQLSDGIRNTIALVADLAYRAVQISPHLGERAALESGGIVLIDEVDMHLHPSWQQTILADLAKAFPNLQFIVATHSPQVLSTVRRENIRVIGQSREGQMIAEPPLAMTYGEPSGDVMHSVMMVDPQPPVREKQDLQHLTELIDQGAYASDEAQYLMQELVSAFGEQHPQLQRLQRSIQRQKVLRR